MRHMIYMDHTYDALVKNRIISLPNDDASVELTQIIRTNMVRVYMARRV